MIKRESASLANDHTHLESVALVEKRRARLLNDEKTKAGFHEQHDEDGEISDPVCLLDFLILGIPLGIL